jgi:hypothetical protein
MPIGVPGDVGSILLINPPYLEAVPDTGVVTDGLGAAVVVVTTGFVAAGVVEDGVVAAGAVVAGAVVVGVLVPHPVITKANTRKIAKGTRNFFMHTSSTNFYMSQDDFKNSLRLRDYFAV